MIIPAEKDIKTAIINIFKDIKHEHIDRDMEI